MAYVACFEFLMLSRAIPMSKPMRRGNAFTTSFHQIGGGIEIPRSESGCGSWASMFRAHTESNSFSRYFGQSTNRFFEHNILTAPEALNF